MQSYSLDITAWPISIPFWGLIVSKWKVVCLQSRAQKLPHPEESVRSLFSDNSVMSSELCLETSKILFSRIYDMLHVSLLLRSFCSQVRISGRKEEQMLKLKSQDESRNGLAGRDLKDQLVPTPLQTLTWNSIQDRNFILQIYIENMKLSGLNSLGQNGDYPLYVG